jgi:SOS response regulatory protein OraA/RecX
LDETSAALGLGRNKLRTYGKLEPAVARRRLGAFLVRRGYGYDVVKPALDQLFGEQEDSDDSGG